MKFILDRSILFITVGGAHQISHGDAGYERHDAFRHIERRRPGAEREKTEMRQRARGAEQGGGATERCFIALHAYTRQQGQP